MLARVSKSCTYRADLKPELLSAREVPHVVHVVAALYYSNWLSYVVAAPQVCVFVALKTLIWFCGDCLASEFAVHGQL